MPEFKDILCIVNPESGLRQGERMGRRLAARFEERGRRCVLRRTAGLGDAARWAAAAAAEGFDLILAVGGDGTVQEVVEGLMRTDTRVPVAHVPVGTANIIAIALSLPWSTRLAMDVIENGQVLPFDVGHVPLLERHFVLMAGIGYPARIIQGAPRRHKKLLGFLAYVASGLRNLFLPAHARITVDADGRILSAVGHTALVINIGGSTTSSCACPARRARTTASSTSR
jgi:diacylglycerol kinase (ATP)